MNLPLFQSLTRSKTLGTVPELRQIQGHDFVVCSGQLIIPPDRARNALPLSRHY